MTGTEIKEARLARGWTQAELAKRLGMCSAVVGHWENERHKPSFIAYARVRKALGIGSAKAEAEAEDMNNLPPDRTPRSPDTGEVEAFMAEARMVECERYHARLTREACASYRKRNPDACRGCDLNVPERRRSRRAWTRKKLVEALREYAARNGGQVSLIAFKEDVGVSSFTIRRVATSWVLLCKAVGVEPGRPGRKAGTGRIRVPARMRLTLDFSDCPDVFEALVETAKEYGARSVEEQTMRVLRGFVE